MFAYLGLILVVVSWFAGAYLVVRWHDKSLPTLSQHAAGSKEGRRFFATVLIGCGGLFYFWLIQWFVPQLGLGLAFVALLTLATAGQLIAAVVPDTVGWQRSIHRYAAYGMAVLWLPLAGFIVAAPDISAVGRVICVVAALYMFVTFIIGTVCMKLQDRYLLFQILYIMVFQTLILAAAYV